MIDGSSHFHISGGTWNQVCGSQSNVNHLYHGQSDEDILRLLAEHAAVNAARDAEARYPAPNCHPNTRVTGSKQTGPVDQKRGEQDDYKSRLGSWPAGVGKSSIAQKVSEDHESRLVGAFFFSRNDSTRDELDRFLATIAYQCCTSDRLKDVVGPFIIDAIRSPCSPADLVGTSVT